MFGVNATTVELMTLSLSSTHRPAGSVVFQAAIKVESWDDRDPKEVPLPPEEPLPDAEACSPVSADWAELYGADVRCSSTTASEALRASRELIQLDKVEADTVVVSAELRAVMVESEAWLKGL
jgi:hypothetical protein